MESKATGRPSTFPSEDKQRVADLRGQGLSAAETAAKLGISTKTVVYLTPRSFLEQERIAIETRKDRAISMARAGKSQTEIHHATGELKPTILRWLRQASVVPVKERRSLNDSEIERIRQNRALPAKERQTNASLADAFGVGATTVKSAIRNLNLPHFSASEVRRHTTEDLQKAAVALGLKLLEPSALVTTNAKISVRCHCGTEFETLTDTVLRGNVNSCGCLNSAPQRELFTFLTSLGLQVEQNNNKLLKGMNQKQDGKYEIDLLLPGLALAVEYCGLYHHSSEVLAARGERTSYHKQKCDLLEGQGISLLTIFEDEWLERKGLVLSVLRAKVGLAKDRISGRRCELTQDQVRLKDFVKNGHLQGDCNGTHLGLIHKGDVVAAMVFRRNLRLSEKGWELARYCNAPDTVVVGGFSKLLAAFVRGQNPVEIVSLSDRRWSSGGVYIKNGFTKVCDSPQSYWYIVGRKRIHKSNYRLDRLKEMGWYEEGKSESEITAAHRLRRIYDCGKVTWKWTNPLTSSPPRSKVEP